MYKPRRGETPLWDFPEGTLCAREVATYVVARTLGWPNVPATVLRDGPYGIGSVQRFVPADPEEHYFTLARALPRRVPTRRRVRPGHQQRRSEGGHCLLGEDGRIYVVDHGVCFSEEPKLRTVIWDFIGDTLEDQVRADIRRLAGEVREGPVREELANLLAAPELAALEIARLGGGRAGAVPRAGGGPPSRSHLAADLMHRSGHRRSRPRSVPSRSSPAMRASCERSSTRTAATTTTSTPSEDRRRTASIRREVDAYFRGTLRAFETPADLSASRRRIPAAGAGDGEDDPLRGDVDLRGRGGRRGRSPRRPRGGQRARALPDRAVRPLPPRRPRRTEPRKLRASRRPAPVPPAPGGSSPRRFPALREKVGSDDPATASCSRCSLLATVGASCTTGGTAPERRTRHLLLRRRWPAPGTTRGRRSASR